MVCLSGNEYEYTMHISNDTTIRLHEFGTTKSANTTRYFTIFFVMFNSSRKSKHYIGHNYEGTSKY